MSVTRKSNARRKGFTLIELLIVILVLAILMAVALPLYLGAVADSQKKTCRANMQTIANAEQAYRTSDPAHQYTNDLTALTANLGGSPICPSTGTSSYTVDPGPSNMGPIVISCSYVDPNGNTANDHGSFTPGVDGN